MCKADCAVNETPRARAIFPPILQDILPPLQAVREELTAIRRKLLLADIVETSFEFSCGMNGVISFLGKYGLYTGGYMHDTFLVLGMMAMGYTIAYLLNDFINDWREDFDLHLLVNRASTLGIYHSQEYHEFRTKQEKSKKIIRSVFWVASLFLLWLLTKTKDWHQLVWLCYFRYATFVSRKPEK